MHSQWNTLMHKVKTNRAKRRNEQQCNNGWGL